MIAVRCHAPPLNWFENVDGSNMIALGHSIKTLPLQQELESRAVLKAMAAAHRRLAELKGVARTIPNETI